MNLNNVCSVPLGALLADYMLEQGDKVKVQVKATNIYGTSALSALDAAKQVEVQTVPHMPLSAPSRGSQTT